MEFGFWSTLQQLIDSLDPLGEKNALRVKNHSIVCSRVFQPFSSRGTIETLLSVWRNLDTQNIVNLRILTERSKELLEPRLENIGLFK